MTSQKIIFRYPVSIINFLVTGFFMKHFFFISLLLILSSSLKSMEQETRNRLPSPSASQAEEYARFEYKSPLRQEGHAFTETDVEACNPDDKQRRCCTRICFSRCGFTSICLTVPLMWLFRHQIRGLASSCGNDIAMAWFIKDMVRDE